MNLKLIDTFTPAYEKWETRPPTVEEMNTNHSPHNIKVNLIESVADAHAAAEYMARVGADNNLHNYIHDALSASDVCKEWLRAMPSRTPAAISCYQKNYENCDLDKVSIEIDQHGSYLSSGQYLFHGGLWPGGSSFKTKHPLSTTFCPQVALRNADWKAKAYDNGRLDLFVLHVTKPTTKAFVFKQKGTNLGHECEVLLASGVKLTLKACDLIRSDYFASKYGQPDKEIPIYVLNVEVS